MAHFPMLFEHTSIEYSVCLQDAILYGLEPRFRGDFLVPDTR